MCRIIRRIIWEVWQPPWIFAGLVDGAAAPTDSELTFSNDQ